MTPFFHAEEDLLFARAAALPVEAALTLYASPEPERALRDVLTSDPLVMHAIMVASPSLHAELDSWLCGRRVASERAIVRALAYVVRMSTRATPFGLFASVGIPAVGSATSLQLDDEGYRTHTTVGAAVRRIATAAGPTDADRLLYNSDSAFERSGRLYAFRPAPVNDADEPAAAGALQCTVLRMNAAVRAVQAACEPGATAGELTEMLRSQFDLSHDDATSIVDRMRTAHAIAAPVVAAPIGNVVEEALALVPAGAVGRRAALVESVRACAAYDAQPLPERSAADYERLVEGIRGDASALPPADAACVVLSHRHTGSLGRQVIDDAAQLAELLCRTTRTVELATLRERFLRRYESPFAVVPLLQLADPDFGLGDPGHSDVACDDSGRAYDATRYREALHAMQDGRTEIVIADGAVDQWFPPLQADRSLPDSMDVGFAVIAGCAADVARGDYLLAGIGYITPEGGKALARFACGPFPQHEPQLRRLASRARSAATVDAELVYLPSHTGHHDIMTRPLVRDYVIEVGTRSGRSAARRLQLDDLYVYLDGGRFRLYSKSLDRLVAVHESHLVTAPKSAGPLCRFLSLLTTQGVRTMDFDWGAAARFPMLPRVRVGRVVVSLATWQMDRNVLAGGDDALARWRSRFHVPRHVSLVQGSDRALLVDFESATARRLLRDQARHGVDEPLVFKEAFVHDGSWLERGGRPHASEFVVTVTAARPNATTPVERPRVSVGGRRAYGPASEWLYLKVFAGRNFWRGLLSGAVSRLVDDLHARNDVDRWFYLTYGEGGPHLRLRFHLTSSRAREPIVKAADRWLLDDLCEHVCVDTFSPDVERYGGADGYAEAERLFCVGSADALARLRAGDPGVADAVVAADALVRGTYDDDALHDVVALLSAERAPSTARFRRTVRIAAAGMARARLADVPPAYRSDLRARALDRPLPDVFSDILHMHFNRFGMTTADEAFARGVLRAAYVSRIARMAACLPAEGSDKRLTI